MDKAALGVCRWCKGCIFKASCTMLVAVGTVYVQYNYMLGSGNCTEFTYALL